MIFQSTRPSQTSTIAPKTRTYNSNDFNPRGLRRPRLPILHTLHPLPLFQSTRPSQTSTIGSIRREADGIYFNPRGLRRPRRWNAHCMLRRLDFNPRGLRRPRPNSVVILIYSSNFNPRGLRRPRRGITALVRPKAIFQSTRPSQTSTPNSAGDIRPFRFQSTRPSQTSTLLASGSPSSNFYFNPRGLRRPRPGEAGGACGSC